MMAARQLPAFLMPVSQVTPEPRIGAERDGRARRLARERAQAPGDAANDILGENFAEARAVDPAAPALLVAVVAAAPGAGAAAPGQYVVANVSMTGQEQSNWCWASVTQSVDGWASSQLTQQDIATAHIQASGRTSTCAPPNATATTGRSCATGKPCRGGCNDQHILSVVLTENHRLLNAVNAPPPFKSLTALLNANKPVPCRVAWNKTAGHFIVVIGWTIDASGTEKVHVLDPASTTGGMPVSPKIWRYADFVARYGSGGATGTINYSYEVQ